MRSEKGSGTSEVFFIIALVIYFLFMGYLGNAAGYTTSAIGSISNWSLPYVNTGFGWLTATVDFLIAIVNIFAWVIASLVSYVALIGFGFSGGLPLWINAFLFTPLALGMGWLVLSMVRGR